MLRIRMRMCLVAVFACSLGTVWGGLGPHEVVVLVNSRSPRSMEVANHFVHLRRIPEPNVIYLDLPDRVLDPKAEISPQEFTDTIWDPVQRILRERRLDHVLAWIYSVDFPVRITSTPEVSLMGMTFLRNRFPEDSEPVEKGLYASPFFAGPDSSDGPKALGVSLLRAREGLGEDMPIPSMMLGFVGSRGTDVDTVIRTLRYGQVADRTMPRGTIYWLTGDDVRARIREWQFPVVQSELKQSGIQSEIVSSFPRDKTDVMGMQMGAQSVSPRVIGRFLPGAMAEHLTSFGAGFHLPYQAKLTDWIRAGATASAGTVTEPYSLWTKFPHARFFAHYARGHTMLESFYLSIRSPTQILLVGEPLSRPWSPRLMLTLISLEDMPIAGKGTFYAGLMPEVPGVRMTYRFFVDGLPAAESSEKKEWVLAATDMADGYHELRVVSLATGPIVQSVQQQLGFTVRNHGRSVAIRSPSPRSEIPLFGSFRLAVVHEGEPEEIGVMHHERILAQSRDTKGSSLEIDPTLMGKGPVHVHAYARYADGMVVRSEPLRVEINDGPAPVIHEVRREIEDGRIRWSADVESAGAPASTTWYRPLWRDAAPDTVIEGDTGRVYQVRMLEGSVRAPGRFTAQMTFPVNEPTHPALELAGLAFDVQDENNFRYFALDGGPSAWAIGTVRNGKRTADLARGRYIPLHLSYELTLVLVDERTVEGYVNHERILRHALDQPVQSGRIGLLGGTRTVTFHRPMGEIGSDRADGLYVAGGMLHHAKDGFDGKIHSVVLRVLAAQWMVERPVSLEEP